ncbi:MAG: hypothetical protein L7S52_07125 [Flavobacteriaceae bacterium]|nr:hypothetical protein [Flavobacteriaceae bacterium]
MKNTLIAFYFSIYLLAVNANASPLPSYFITQPTSELNVSFEIVYQDNALFITGEEINGTLKIFSIIGNKIVDINVQDFSKLVIPINLDRQNLYIIRIETSNNKIITHKVVAH